MKTPTYSILILMLLLGSCISGNKTSVQVMDLNSVCSVASPGDTIFIESGTFEDVSLDLNAKGTKDSPIYILAENPGELILKGGSSLHLSGEFYTISGIHFDDGHSTNGAVISFRAKDGNSLAKGVRVTQCAISNYSNPDRIASDHWIEVFGRENRFDHNYVGTKFNLGATMVMRLADSVSTDNRNSIDSNYFAPKPRLGSNGGETLRIGSSAHSLKKGGAKVVANYFDRCSGEVEVLSIKSSDNSVTDNVFFECSGVLALRHGNRNKIYRNKFFGNDKSETGGLRVINAGHSIRHNYFQGVTGKRFFAALAVMNGVPNSAINRYHQVSGVDISNNTWVNCENISFGVGSDNERTAAPESTLFTDNSIIYSNPTNAPKFLDDVDGIEFKGNVTNSFTSLDGFTPLQSSLANVQVEKDDTSLKSLVGPHWLDKDGISEEIQNSNRRVTISPSNANEINSILQDLQGGDTIEFESGQVYTINQPISINSDAHLLVSGDDHAIIQPGKGFKGALIQIEQGVNLNASKLWFIGRNQANNASYGIEAQAPMLEHYNLFINDCRFSDFKESRYAGIHAKKGTFADTIVILNSWFKDFSGHGISLNTENDDRGRYNAEYITIDNCKFIDMMGSAIDVYRGGNDESTLGPFVTINDCDFINVCNRELGTTVRMIGVQWSRIRDCRFSDSGKSGRSIWFEDPAWADIQIDHIVLSNSGKIQTFYDYRVDWSSIDKSPLQINRGGLSNWQLR
jgi:poly(beta-D-mannuronate) lyase